VSVVDKSRYLTCLESDYRRLREVAPLAPAAQVPSCPEWTMADLVTHVAKVYVDKTETMRTGHEQTWPPELPVEDPIGALDATYTALVKELTDRPAAETSLTWYKPDQTVGFWVRRMAQETVIHRVDGELAAGAPLASIPDDLALDGIDEVLTCFLAYSAAEYAQWLGEPLATADGREVRLDAGSTSWSVRIAPDKIEISTAPADTAARVSGSPTDVLLWLWRRTDADAVAVDGDTELVGRLRELLGTATQ
jgi:uncharacterized protein (TIGR03083 family)